MADRWRRNLGLLDAPEPSHDLWDRAVTTSRETLPPMLPPRRAQTLLAITVAVLVAAAGVITLKRTFGRPEADPATPPAETFETYRDPRGVWEVTYPAAFHRGELRGPSVPRFSTEGIWLANFADPRFDVGETAPSNLPAEGAYISISQFFGGPLVLPEADSGYPVGLARFESIETREAGLFLAGGAAVNGERYSIILRAGPEASGDDVESLREIAASFRVLPLRTGTATGRAHPYYVLAERDAYPPGSVTRFDVNELPRSEYGAPFPFYLVSTEQGLYALSWLGNREDGYKDCDVTFDRESREFSCPTGARWAIDGSVIDKPPGDPVDDPLDVMLVRISFDGFVMVSPAMTVDIATDLRLT